MTEVARLIGGAGTGKTTELLRLMAATIDAGVRDPHEIGFVSFTRAARREAAQRASETFGVEIESLEKHGWFRTLHSVCYRCTDTKAGSLLTDDKESTDWLREKLGSQIPEFREDGLPVPQEQNSPVAQSMQLWHLARNRCESLESTWREVRRFRMLPSIDFCAKVVRKYELAKALDHRCDYTDLLSQFCGMKFHAEEQPRQSTPQGWIPALPVWFFDEQQDTSALLDKVCRRLISAPTVKWVYVVGDPFQSIYGWAGADASHFLGLEVNKERVMPKSYRCPAPMMELGERLLSRCENYFDRSIEPADHQGEIISTESVSVDPRESWLVIGRTNYAANKFAQTLDDQGIPWVPTRGGGKWVAPVRNSAIATLHALQHGAPIGGEEWSIVCKHLPSRDSKTGDVLLKRGTKKRFEDVNEQSRFLWVMLRELEEMGATSTLIERIRRGDWLDLIKGAKQFAGAIDRFGPDACLQSKVRVGTIHSVKGAEADNVVLMTESTRTINDAANNSRAVRDEERRVGYVAATRARRRLFIVDTGRRNMVGFE